MLTEEAVKRAEAGKNQADTADRTGDRGPKTIGASDLIPRFDLIRTSPTASRTRDELLRIGRSIRLDRKPSKHDAEEALLRLALLAYPDRVCRRRSSDPSAAAMVGGGGVRLAPESIVRNHEFFVALDARTDDRSANREAERHHVTLPQWLALGCIGSEGETGITHSELCNRLMLSKAPVTGIVDRLVRDGYVQRIADRTDRRVTRIVINPEGIAVWVRVRDAMREHAAAQCEDFSEEELQTAIELLSRLTSKVASTDPTLAHCGSRSHAKTSVGDES